MYNNSSDFKVHLYISGIGVLTQNKTCSLFDDIDYFL